MSDYPFDYTLPRAEAEGVIPRVTFASDAEWIAANGWALPEETFLAAHLRELREYMESAETPLAAHLRELREYMESESIRT